MEIIPWDASYSVNVNKIDEQHKKLIAMLNDFYRGIIEQSNKQVVLELIVKMKEYTQYHFQTEEDYFKQYGYPDTEKHIEEHLSFIKKVAEFEERVEKGGLVLSFELTDFLKKWIVKHVKESDKAYAGFLNSKGVF